MVNTQKVILRHIPKSLNNRNFIEYSIPTNVIMTEKGYYLFSRRFNIVNCFPSLYYLVYKTTYS